MPYSVQKFRGGYAMVWNEGEKRHRRKLYAAERSSGESEARQLWQQANTEPWTVGRIVIGYISALGKSDPPSLQRRKDAWQAMAVIERGGEPIASVKKAFLAASVRSGVKVTPYTLRQTGAVWAAEGGQHG